jgi:S1-C subfamily serine protease
MKLSLNHLAVYLSFLAIGGGVGLLSSRFFSPQSSFSQQLTPVNMTLPPDANFPNSSGVAIAPSVGEDVNFIATAVQKVGPAVVRINATRRVTNPISEALKNPIFKRFFGEEEEAIPQEKIERGTGTGFILSEDGKLITNAHVVSNADIVQVTLKDGRTIDGNVVGVDNITDIAVVKLNSEKSLPKVKLGNSQNLIAGQWAIAIGNPLGLDNTVTIGIISATDRTSAQVGVPDKRVSFIQTDAAINPGNSGGPLLNAQGEVIGVNTAIRADAQGLGFAIPIEIAARIADELFTKGHVEHPYLGVDMLDLNPGEKLKINQEGNIKVNQDSGILIKKVLENTSAQKVGLLGGDLIQKVNRRPVKIMAQVQKIVESSSVGDTMELEINRYGKILSLKVKLGPLPKK